MGGDAPSLDGLIGGVECEAGGVAWHGLRIGMTLHEAEELLSSSLSPTRDEFFGWMASTSSRGFGVTLGMSEADRDAAIRSITLTIPEPWDVREMASALKHRYPGIEYRASRHAPELGELDNPTPGYVFCDERKAYILLKPELIWIQLGQAGE